MTSLASKPLDFKILLKQAEENKNEAHRKLDERRHRNTSKNNPLGPDRQCILNYIRRKKEKENEMLQAQKVENKERLIRSLMVKRGGKKEAEILLRQKNNTNESSQKSSVSNNQKQVSNKVSSSSAVVSSFEQKVAPTKRPLSFNDLMKMAAINLESSHSQDSSKPAPAVSKLNRSCTQVNVLPSSSNNSNNVSLKSEMSSTNKLTGQKRKSNGTPVTAASRSQIKASSHVQNVGHKTLSPNNGKKTAANETVCSKSSKVVRKDECSVQKRLSMTASAPQKMKSQVDHTMMARQQCVRKKNPDESKNVKIEQNRIRPGNQQQLQPTAKVAVNRNDSKPCLKDVSMKIKQPVKISVPKADPTKTQKKNVFSSRVPYRPPKKGKYVKSESEIDSELEDFIDDEPCGEVDQEEISNTIRSIFKYDKRSFRDMDDDEDDLTSMETSFRDILKEEKRSARLGLLEDLEDIIREEREKQKLKKKKK